MNSSQGKGRVENALADALRVTSPKRSSLPQHDEGNNIVSSGLDLKAGDEVIVWADNHPSNLERLADEGASDFGFTVVGAAWCRRTRHRRLRRSVREALHARTKLVAITHVNSKLGRSAARSRDLRGRSEAAASLSSWMAQSFGVLDIDLAAMKPDFYTGSMHKVARAARRKKGLLYANRAVHDRIHPSVIGVATAERLGLSR
jgi:selenocysteine lyase/cysteine desulfurase